MQVINRLFWVLVVLAVLLVSVFVGGWFFAASQVDSLVDEALARAQGQGWVVKIASRESLGLSSLSYDYALSGVEASYALENLVVTIPGSVQVGVSALAPNKLRASTAGTTVVNYGPFTARMDDAQVVANASFDPGVDGANVALESLSLELGEIKLVDTMKVTAAFESGGLDGGGAGYAEVNLGETQLGEFVVQQISQRLAESLPGFIGQMASTAAGAALSEPMFDLGARLRLEPSGPIITGRDSLRQWSLAGGYAVIEEVRPPEVDMLEIQANGVLFLSANGELYGQICPVYKLGDAQVPQGTLVLDAGILRGGMVLTDEILPPALAGKSPAELCAL